MSALSPVLLLSCVVAFALAAAWRWGGRLVCSLACGLLLGPTVYVTIGMTVSKLPGSRTPRFFSFPLPHIAQSELSLLGNLLFWCAAFAAFGFAFGRRGRARK